jgi:hypothetical protein
MRIEGDNEQSAPMSDVSMSMASHRADRTQQNERNKHKHALDSRAYPRLQRRTMVCSTIVDSLERALSVSPPFTSLSPSAVPWLVLCTVFRCRRSERPRVVRGYVLHQQRSSSTLALAPSSSSLPRSSSSLLLKLRRLCVCVFCVFLFLRLCS